MTLKWDTSQCSVMCHNEKWLITQKTNNQLQQLPLSFRAEVTPVQRTITKARHRLSPSTGIFKGELTGDLTWCVGHVNFTLCPHPQTSECPRSDTCIQIQSPSFQTRASSARHFNTKAGQSGYACLPRSNHGIYLQSHATHKGTTLSTVRVLGWL